MRAVIVFLAATASATAALGGSAGAESPGRDIPYSGIYSMLLAAKPADPDGVISARMCAKPGKDIASLAPDLALELRRGDAVQPLTLDASHCFVPPLDPAWTDPATLLHVNQPKGAVSLSLDLRSRLPTGLRLTYAGLMESMEVMQRIIATQGVLARVMGPKFSGVVLRYRPPGAQTATVHAPTGDRVYRSDDKGELHVPYDAKLATAMVDLSALPQAIDPDGG